MKRALFGWLMMVAAATLSAAFAGPPIARFKALAARYHARVVIQHAPKVLEILPPFPGYLD